MIYSLDDAMDAIQGELSRHGDGDVELDVWENKSEGLWYAALRTGDGFGRASLITITGTEAQGIMIDHGPTMRAAILRLARRIER